MTQLNWQDIFIINRFSTSRWDSGFNNELYFQIIFIEDGSGRINLDGKVTAFKSRDIFIFNKNEVPQIKIHETTTFIIFKFTDLLFSSKVSLPDKQYWLRRSEFILNHPKRRFQEALKSIEERDLIWRILFFIRKENTNKEQYHLQIIANMVSTILSVLARNITETNPESSGYSQSKKKERIDEIYAYIRYNIYDSSMLKISVIAKHFHITSSTLSNYFKKETGNSLHNYILLYKLEIAKDRLLNSDFTVSQIALQLGFTDESHLTRIFKKYCESTPKQYKDAHVSADK
ncbi:helix-turn-helix domain-containing protein [Leeuwenhoekiella marinoflava]|uniref:AraC family transcriptional regulator n=2 Tax=Leeuwenhoekiella marinoflava TaxID=988 RepID=A0A4Q0PH85_9FLAO|nr:AraC family transcriptional regulator [Leeuwenhoekiella marinoflava]RXG25936.1 AraC family transcriptional regulator [Leeuwenhoekiella marinoflava]SHF73546.1 transcriptional regulator, AraC family [Leeuwenhoekiella marinoflava DSM 3653]